MQSRLREEHTSTSEPPLGASRPGSLLDTTKADDNELSEMTSEPAYPPTAKVIAIITPILLTAFLIALDRLIIGVAVPRITDQFHSLGDVGWYGSAYLLTSCSFMLLGGKLYTLFDPKWVYLGALVIFEVGSAVCGGAPNSKSLIVGRAIAGLGQAGLFQGTIIIIVYIVPLHKRPQVMGIGGMVFGIACAIGPLVGGAFTSGPGWRWCFYINLPCGALVFTLLVFFLQIPPEMLQRKPASFKEKVKQIDPLGAIFFPSCVICLLLALQWGGLEYQWSNVRIIVLIVLSGLLFIAFVIVQRRRGDTAMVPGHIFFNRSVLAGAWFSFFNGASMQTLLFYLLIWFQAIKGSSAIRSGIMTLPLVIGIVVASLAAGILTKKLGYFTPWMLLSSMLTPIGAGLISTFSPHTAGHALIGYQALAGLGFGFGAQQPSVAAQTVLPRKDVAIGASLMMFCQVLGGAVFICVGNNIFQSALVKNLAHISGINLDSVANVGATDLREMVPKEVLPQVLVAYNGALRDMFYLVTGLTCVMILGAASMEWKSVKNGNENRNRKPAPGVKDGTERPEKKAQPEASNV
jgi:MFS family permease